MSSQISTTTQTSGRKFLDMDDLKAAMDKGYLDYFVRPRPVCPTEFKREMSLCWTLGFKCAHGEHSAKMKGKMPWDKECVAL